MEAEMKRKLLREDEKPFYYFKFQFNSLLRADSKSRAEFYNIGIRGGWLSPNDARRFEDMDILTDGETTYTESNLVPSDMMRPWIQSKIDAYRAQDLSRKDYLIKNYCSHHAGWVEKNPGTCQAGGPPPICPVDHWIEVGTDRAINQYYTDVANEKKRRIQEIENGSQQVKEALEVKDATITANAMNKKTTQIEKEYNKDNKALNKEMSKQAATLSGAVQNLNNMNNGISGFQGNVTSDEQWDEVYSKKNITNVNSIDNLADQGIKAAQNKTNEWINGNVNENVILDNLSNSSINPKFKLFSNGLKASNEVASKGLEILTEINEGNVRKLGERTLDATITNDFNKTISKFSYNQINDVADNVNSKVISELTNALTSENSDESVKNLERNFTPEGLLLS